jgi:hypothetical protein
MYASQHTGSAGIESLTVGQSSHLFVAPISQSLGQ